MADVPNVTTFRVDGRAAPDRKLDADIPLLPGESRLR